MTEIKICEICTEKSNNTSICCDGFICLDCINKVGKCPFCRTVWDEDKNDAIEEELMDINHALSDDDSDEDEDEDSDSDEESNRFTTNDKDFIELFIDFLESERRIDNIKWPRRNESACILYKNKANGTSRLRLIAKFCNDKNRADILDKTSIYNIKKKSDKKINILWNGRVIDSEKDKKWIDGLLSRDARYTRHQKECIKSFLLLNNIMQ